MGVKGERSLVNEAKWLIPKDEVELLLTFNNRFVIFFTVSGWCCSKSVRVPSLDRCSVLTICRRSDGEDSSTSRSIFETVSEDKGNEVGTSASSMNQLGVVMARQSTRRQSFVKINQCV